MIRQTKQRTAILDVIKDSGRPLTTNEILELGKRVVPNLGLRTVYRNLKELMDAQKVVCVDYPGQPTRYEVVTNREHCVHFICRECERLYDLDIETPDFEVKPPEGFQVDGDEVILYGKCPSCLTVLQ